MNPIPPHPVSSHKTAAIHPAQVGNRDNPAVSIICVICGFRLVFSELVFPGEDAAVAVDAGITIADGAVGDVGEFVAYLQAVVLAD